MTHTWLDRIADFFSDPSLIEVTLNGPEITHFRTAHNDSLGPVVFTDHTSMMQNLQMYAIGLGLRLDPKFPCSGGILNLNQLSLRWHFIIPPAAKWTIASFRRHYFYHIDNLEFKPNEKWHKVQSIFQKREPLLLCGASGSGKTSLLTKLLKESSIKERVVIIEDIAELPTYSPYWIHLLGKKPDLEGKYALSLRSLFQESLRLAPDRLIVGEMRTQDAGMFFEAVLAGHPGCTATIHSKSSQSLLARISYLCRDKFMTLQKSNSSTEGTLIWGVFLDQKTQAIEEICPFFAVS